MNEQTDTTRTDSCWAARTECNILDHARQLERELTAVTKERDELQRLYHKVIQEVLQCNPIPANKRDDDNLEPPWEVIRRVRQQRDALAEALRDIETFNPKDLQCDSGYTPVFVAKKALATLEPQPPTP